MKIVQVVHAEQIMPGGTGVGTIVLCDDGSLWRLEWWMGNGATWVRVKFPEFPPC